MPQTRDTVRTLIEDFLTSREMIPPTWDTTRLRDPTSEGHHVHTVRDTCEEYPTWVGVCSQAMPYTPSPYRYLISFSVHRPPFSSQPCSILIVLFISFDLSFLVFSRPCLMLISSFSAFSHYPTMLISTSNLYFSSFAFAAMSSSFSPSLSIFAISKLYHTLSAFLALELFISLLNLFPYYVYRYFTLLPFAVLFSLLHKL